MHANDVVVITESVLDLQQVANRWHQAAIEDGMRIKTRIGTIEMMLILKRKEECNIYMAIAKIYQMEFYSYLGVNIEY